MVGAMALSVEEASARQARPCAAELGLAPADAMDELASLPTRVRFLNALHREVRCPVTQPAAGGWDEAPAWGACTASGRVQPETVAS